MYYNNLLYYFALQRYEIFDKCELKLVNCSCFVYSDWWVKRILLIHSVEEFLVSFCVLHEAFEEFHCLDRVKISELVSQNLHA